MAGSLILYEASRSRRKEKDRREGIADAIEALQKEIEELKSSKTKRSVAERPKKHPRTLKVVLPTDTQAAEILKPNYAEVINTTIKDIREGRKNLTVDRNS